LEIVWAPGMPSLVPTLQHWCQQEAHSN